MIIEIQKEKDIELIKQQCMYCNKVIGVLCGTPLIQIGGCCYGARTKKKTFLFSRKAHIGCWLKHNKFELKPKQQIKEKKE